MKSSMWYLKTEILEVLYYSEYVAKKITTINNFHFLCVLEKNKTNLHTIRALETSIIFY